MKKWVRNTLFIFLFCSVNLFSQEDTDVYKYWINTGGGVSTEHDLSLLLSYTFGYEKFYQVAFNDSQNFSLFGDSDKQSLKSLSFAYGTRVKYEWFYATAFAGIALVRHRNYNHKLFQPGIYLNSQAMFRLANEVGLGVNVYTVLTFNKSVVGLRFCISLGNGK